MRTLARVGCRVGQRDVDRDLARLAGGDGQVAGERKTPQGRSPSVQLAVALVTVVLTVD